MSSSESDDGSDFGFDFNSRIIDDDALKKLISTNKSNWNDHIHKNENPTETNNVAVDQDAGEMSDDSTKTVDFSFESFQATAKRIVPDKSRTGSEFTATTNDQIISTENDKETATNNYSMSTIVISSDED